MGNIYKRGKIWYLDIRVKNRRIRKRVGTSKKIAELALKDAEIKSAREEFGFSKNDISLDKFFGQFQDYSRVNHRNATTRRYSAVIDHFRAFLKENDHITFISEVTPELIERYKVYRKDSWINPNGSEVKSESDLKEHTRKGTKAHTINFEIDTLRALFNLAIKWGYLKDNPTVQVKRLRVTDTIQLEFLSIEDTERLLKATPKEFYPVYFTFLNTGMRKAELENLEWADIDFKRKKIRIRRKEFWQPKTGEREIPISQPMYDLLTNLKKENDKGHKSNFVFSDPKTGGKLRTKLREKLIQIAKQAGLKGLTKLHTLRHTFASHLVMQGVDLPTVGKLMGHSDVETTMIYAHLAPDHLARAVTRLPFKTRE